MNEEIAKELWKQSLSNKLSIAIVLLGMVFCIVLLVFQQDVPPFLAQLAPIWFFSIVQVVGDIIEQVISFSHDINAESNFKKLMESMNQEQIAILICFLVQNSQRLTFVSNESELKNLTQSKVLNRLGLTALALSPLEEAVTKPVQGEEYEIVNGYWHAMLKADIQAELLQRLNWKDKPQIAALAKEQKSNHNAVLFALSFSVLSGILVGFFLAKSTLDESHARAIAEEKKMAQARAFEVLSGLSAGTVAQNKLTDQVLNEARSLNNKIAESLKRQEASLHVGENRSQSNASGSNSTDPIQPAEESRSTSTPDSGG